MDAIPMAQRASNNHVTAADAVFLSRDVIATILVRLPASVLRRFCLVCKKWRDVISDPTFIKAHMVQGSHAPTHTVVFVPSSKERTTGSGFLFDESWQLTARFTVGASEVMIGTCNGLLCFHGRLQKIIRIVEPFTGEAITLPEPTYPLHRYIIGRSYCLGFDSMAGQYKIIGKHITYHKDNGSCTVCVNLFTVGADKNWRTVSTAYVSLSNVSFSHLSCNGRAVYWRHKGHQDGTSMYTRLDLATEEITSVECRLLDRRTIFCHHPLWQNGHPCIIGIRLLSEDGCWPSDMDSMAHEVDAVTTLPHGLRIPRQQALQRGHLLLVNRSGALYAHKIVSRSIRGLDIGCQQLLVGIGEAEDLAKSSSSGEFITVQGSQWSTAQQATYSGMDIISTFAYVPTVCSAPLALYFCRTMH